MLDTILLDLDGTVLPFHQEEFTKVYIDTLADTLCPLGLDRELFIKALWAGTKAMLVNDGAMVNRQAFWGIFSTVMKTGTYNLEDAMETFYANEFDSCRSVLKEQRQLKPIINSLREKNYKIVLATQPVFPKIAVNTRLKWVGLDTDDFDMITYYDTCSYCKPNIFYYRYIIDAMESRSSECIMMGNDPVDDMLASETGCDTFLVTDYLYNPKGLSTDKYRSGTFADACKYLTNLPPLPVEEDDD